jgi:hypothetical protein
VRQVLEAFEKVVLLAGGRIREAETSGWGKLACPNLEMERLADLLHFHPSHSDNLTRNKTKYHCSDHRNGQHWIHPYASAM